MTADACLACGYDLAGLDLDDRCPECGRAVRDSRRFHLSPAHDGAIDTAFAALAWMRIGVIAIGIGYAVLAIPVVLPGAFDARAAGGLAPVSDASLGVMIAGVALVVVGVLKVRKVMRLLPPAPRRGDVSRPAAAGCLLPVAMAFAVTVVGSVAIVFPIVLLIAVLNVGFMWHLGWLADAIRVPVRTRRGVIRLAWLGPIAGGLGVIALGVGPLVLVVWVVAVLTTLRRQVAAARSTPRPVVPPGADEDHRDPGGPPPDGSQ